MALTNNERMTLNKIANDFYGLVAPVDAMKGSVKAKIGDSIIALNSMSFSSPATIANGIVDLDSRTSAVLPGNTTTAIEDIKRFIEECTYLNELAGEFDDISSQIIKVINNSIKVIFDKIGEFVIDIGAGIPEFEIGKLLDDITSAFDSINFPDFPGFKVPGQFNLTEIMLKADALINCLDLLGEGEYNTEVTEYSSFITNLYSDLRMISNPTDPDYGKLDLSSIYSAAGMTPSEISNMESVQSAIKSVKNNGISSTAAAIETTKSMKSLGLL